MGWSKTGCHISAADFSLNHLIQDYTDYTPTTLDIPWECGDHKSTAGMGTLVKQFLTGDNIILPSQ